MVEGVSTYKALHGVQHMVRVLSETPASLEISDLQIFSHQSSITIGLRKFLYILFKLFYNSH